MRGQSAGERGLLREGRPSPEWPGGAVNAVHVCVMLRPRSLRPKTELVLLYVHYYLHSVPACISVVPGEGNPPQMSLFH